ncbi:SUMF1/EgtB/PvdO family nonheme iron enzyme [Terricaulis sp.]|uniref:SUMF1/EgtB/PvdO family nonheme iron enzyme n=1 Tax=Terricaulis sp. TaxID=2768686 RepID=UPI003784C204
MADVFISYKRDERDAIEVIAKALRGLSLDVWFDASMSAGEAFGDQIDREARAARAVLVCWSPAARESRWVKAEAMIGFDEDKLAACHVSGDDKFSAPAPFNAVHSEDLRSWVKNPVDEHHGWKTILRRIAKLCRRADIETWTLLRENSSAAELRTWIAAHEDSPLFMKVHGALRAREEADDKKARDEKEARWARAIQALNRASSKDVKAFLDRWPDHPEAVALRTSLASIEERERIEAQDTAFGNLDRNSAAAVRSFLAAWPDHPEAKGLQAALPRIETTERQQAKKAEEDRLRAARERDRRASAAKWQRRAAAFIVVSVIAGGLAGWQVVKAQSRERARAAYAAIQAHRANDFDDCGGADWCPVMTRLPNGIAASRNEITIAQWNACRSDGGCQYPQGPRHTYGTRDDPVVGVTWVQATEYVQWLSRRTGQSYRLPSAAEWDHASTIGESTNGLRGIGNSVSEWLEDCAGEHDCGHRLLRDGETSSYIGVSNTSRGFRVFGGSAVPEIEQLTRPVVREFNDCEGANWCPRMAIIPAGTFVTIHTVPELPPGMSEGENVRPPRRVTFAHDFAVSRYEITREQYGVFADETHRPADNDCIATDLANGNIIFRGNWRNPGFPQADNHPVVCVNWDDAQAYIAWLNSRTGGGYRLLSDTEWEYAARAGTASRYANGDSESRLCDIANHADLASNLSDLTSADQPGRRNGTCSDNARFTAPVGSYQPNAFGLYDMYGNVGEYLQDCWDWYPSENDGSPHESGPCTMRLAAGGSWREQPAWLHSDSIGPQNTFERLGYMGFRVAKTLPQN